MKISRRKKFLWKKLEKYVAAFSLGWRPQRREVLEFKCEDDIHVFVIFAPYDSVYSWRVEKWRFKRETQDCDLDWDLLSEVICYADGYIITRDECVRKYGR